MKETGAAGLDGWSPSDLKALPNSLLRYLLLFCDLVGETNEWPRALTWASMTLIPEGEGAARLDQRPLSVMPLVFRVWAAARVRDCLDWQEKWIGGGQHGCRPNHFSRPMHHYALVWKQKRPETALDFSKVFDSEPIAVALAVFKRLGLHERMFDPFVGMYAKLHRRFKIRGCLGAPFIATNGIMQGCPLSALLLNAIVMVLTSAVHGKSPRSHRSISC